MSHLTRLPRLLIKHTHVFLQIDGSLQAGEDLARQIGTPSADVVARMRRRLDDLPD